MITGNLARTPFAHLILYVREHRLSGTLAIWPAGTSDESVAAGEARERADRIYFSSGARKKGRLAEPASSLERGLLPLFQRLDGPFVFYADGDYVGESETVQAAEGSDLALIAASTRGPVRDDVIDGVLGRFLGSAVRLRADSDVRALELLPREQVVLDVLRAGPAPIAELVESGGMEPRAARKVLYLLAITKAIELFDPMRQTSSSHRTPRTARDFREAGAVAAQGAPTPGGAPTASGAPTQSGAPMASSAATPRSAEQSAEVRSSAAAAAPLSPAAASLPGAPRPTRAAARAPDTAPPPPGDLSPEHRALWDELSDRANKLDEQNFFEMLGLDATAGASKARDAYFEIVKRLHPDRLPPPLAPLAQIAQRVFSALTDAHDTLLDEDKRIRYIGIVRDGGGTPAAQRKLEQTIEGTVEFQKAEVLRKSDAASAEQHARRAIELDPEQADYYALLAWTLFERYPGEGAPLAEMLTLVDKAIGMYEKHDRAHYYRGAVLRRSGREGDAVRAFRRAVELNPKNVDAQREVRLADMRAKKGGASKSSEPTDAPTKPEAPKSVGQRDIGEMFKGLFSGKKK